MELTEKNYYQDKTMLSNSTIKEYMECSARAQAKFTGEWEEKGFKDPFAVGHYFESLIMGDSDRVRETEEFKYCMLNKADKSGNRKDNAKAVMCHDMHSMCKDDMLWKIATKGEYERIFTGEIHGVKFRGKLDVFNSKFKTFTDIKTAKDIVEVWSKKHRAYVPFYIERDYAMQLAIYQELIRQEFGELYQPYLAVSSKTKPYLFEVLKVDVEDYWKLEDKLIELKEHIDFVLGIRSGEIEPTRCNSPQCAYCTQSYKLTQAKSMEF